MLEHDQAYSYLTPDRNSKRDRGFNKTTATLGTKFGNLANTHSPVTHTIKVKAEAPLSKLNENEQLKWYQSRVAQLKVYVTQTAKLSKRAISKIFGWNAEPKIAGSEPKLVKELGFKVQNLLKENTEQKIPPLPVIEYEEGSLLVKDMGTELKRLANSVEKYNETEINKGMMSYIQKKRQELEPLIVYQPVKRSPPKAERNLNGQSSGIQSHRQTRQNEHNNELLSVEKVKNLKKYFSLYINTCIEENDQKFEASQKYIKSLENRVAYLQSLQTKIDHLIFQKEVKMQQATQRTKLFSIAGPNVKGDEQIDSYLDAGESIFSQVEPPKPQSPVNYFSSKPKLKKILDKDLQNQFITLREQNQALRQQLFSLKLKYQKQIENHLRDSYDQEKMNFDVQRLEVENGYLKDQLRVRKNKNKDDLICI